MRARRRTPEASQEPSDFSILFGLRKLAQCATGVAIFEQHRAEIFISMEKSNGRISVPKTTCDFVVSFEMWHLEFEHGECAVGTRRWRDPCSGCSFEGSVEDEGPAFGDLVNHSRQTHEPLGCDRIVTAVCL